jgi:small subunit ribosomal protein S9
MKPKRNPRHPRSITQNMPEAKVQTKPKAEKTATQAANEKVVFKGKFLSAVGRRKRSIAQVRLYDKGKGVIIVNDKKLSDYFPATGTMVVQQPLKLAGLQRSLDISVHVSGGGSTGQAEAIRHGISRALVKMNEELRPTLKTKDMLTRDARRTERKKPGLKKARRAPQWSKR